MRIEALQGIAMALLIGVAQCAWAHGCDPLDKYLLGHYHGACSDETELPHGHGEARGADTYVGNFVQGKPEGGGVYKWEKGGRLEGEFKEGKAHGAGVYVSRSGARYKGVFVNGRLATIKSKDCPVTPGPVTC